MTAFDLNSHGTLEIYLGVLYSIIGDTTNKTLIDLCCGEMGRTRHMKFASSIHVDVIDEPLRPRDFAFIQTDVFSEHDVFKRKYDVAFCGDGIEHFTKADGYRLAHHMTLLGRQAIIFTPLGEYMVDPNATGPYPHKSGWLPGDLPGWKTMVFPNWHPTLGIGAMFFWWP